eukprot:gnl/MRDRNA2_/MRDRNA2_86471_c0_seq1.p1 gnl/MRDRNA2_/MRDRNA2_86471_c0~~gnl/MRDRNA2_/MRDRNA2_86471_c0_seq1.p1  ORF type:complete len:107 (+),score=13.29 gnl/MRDRNA2_/MRDRNA2_86471_c0_seq1:166-486(+)
MMQGSATRANFVDKDESSRPAFAKAHAKLPNCLELNSLMHDSDALANIANSDSSDRLAVAKAHASYEIIALSKLPFHCFIITAKVPNIFGSTWSTTANAHAVLPSS